MLQLTSVDANVVASIFSGISLDIRVIAGVEAVLASSVLVAVSSYEINSQLS